MVDVGTNTVIVIAGVASVVNVTVGEIVGVFDGLEGADLHPFKKRISSPNDNIQ